MKKTKTTHLKASWVGDVEWRRGSAVGQRGESLGELRASEKAEMGRRHGLEAWVWGMDRQLRAWVGLGVRRSGSAGRSVTSSFSGPMTLRIESGRRRQDREVRVWESLLRELRVSLRELSVLSSEACTVRERAREKTKKKQKQKTKNKKKKTKKNKNKNKNKTNKQKQNKQTKQTKKKTNKQKNKQILF